MCSFKILAVNSSPQKENGKTVKILNSFLKGAEEAGAETHLEHLYGQDISPCTACYSCWFNTPGECVLKDDMNQLLDKIKDSDIIVFCTPLYFYSVSGVMKNFIDRMLPLLTQYMELKDDYARKTARESMPSKMVLVSSCGIYGMNQFDALVYYFENLEKYLGIEFSGALLRSDAHLTRNYSEVYSAAKKAGAQLVKEGKISPKLLEIISAPVITKEEFVKQTNEYYRNL